MWTDDLEQRAAEVLPEHVYDYFRATAGDLDVLRRQVDAWEAIEHLPRVLRQASSPHVGTAVLGTALRTPVMVAPMAQQVAADPAGEVATARAAAAAGTLLGVSTNTAVRFEDIAAVGAPWWFQLYVMEDRALTEALLERAVAAGARAIVLTVDITGLEHPRAGATVSVEPTEWGAAPEGRRLANLTTEERERARGDGGRIARDLGFETIGLLRERTGLPVVVKGVLRADDARRAVDAGAAGVVVSTHGGRALAGAVPAARALDAVATAVDGNAEVYADSGLRTGAHVASALALGAQAVFVGRPVLWGLATGGADGVQQVLERVTSELRRTMNLLGAPTVADLTRDLVARA
ncbi:alpha-hydroxy acid oxidase [Amnibacterium endophyticum]|uniref:Alpha-hydroxy acid oxidase n=1 Tax=Amnibacterium endophyticum TaxID=2109337 RepID=A0ABW4LAA7_9MICO